MISKAEFMKKFNTDGRIIDRIEDAYDFAEQYHRDQTRKFSDDPYLIHPIRVALSLGSEEDDIIIAAPLHDVVEDGFVFRVIFVAHFRLL